MYLHKQIHLHLHLHLHEHLHLHTNVGTYIHTYIHTCKHTYIHTYVRTYIHTIIHTYIHNFRQTYVHTYIQTKEEARKRKAFFRTRGGLNPRPPAQNAINSTELPQGTRPENVTIRLLAAFLCSFAAWAAFGAQFWHFWGFHFAGARGLFRRSRRPAAKAPKTQHRTQRQKPAKNPTKAALKKNGAACKVLRGRSTGQKTQRPEKTTNAKHHRDQNVTIRRVIWPRWVGAISGQRAACTILAIGKTLLFCYIGKPDRKRTAQNRKKTRSPTSAKNTEKQEK